MAEYGTDEGGGQETENLFGVEYYSHNNIHYIETILAVLFIHIHYVVFCIECTYSAGRSPLPIIPSKCQL